MFKGLSRRNFIKIAACAGLSLTGCIPPAETTSLKPAKPVLSPTTETPVVEHPTSTRMPPPPTPQTPTHAPVSTTHTGSNSGSVVLHIHAPTATHWPSPAVKYWKSVDQEKVTGMVNRGITTLTGHSTITDAWRSLLPGYNPNQAGQIAIKINCNSVESIDDEDEDIESVAEPILAIVAGLVQSGILEGDICIFDAVRGIPDRIYTPIHTAFPGVTFYDGYFRTRATFSNAGNVEFHPPADIPVPNGIQVTDVLVNARYLINVPLLKKHSLPGVTFGFKHHFGSINLPAQLHEYIGLSGAYFRKQYSVLVDIFRNPNIGPKTILTIGDGLFGYTGAGGRSPSPWRTFDNQVPNSLFFSKDPVAIDCVLCDFLNTEMNVPDLSDRYLALAADAGLGIYERANPWQNAYQRISYNRITM